MKRRGIFTALVFALLIPGLLFAGGTDEAAVNGDEQIELVYWSHYGQSPAFVEAFADSVNLAAKNLGYDNVTCRAEVIEYANYEAKYITGFSSDEGPDFFLGMPADWALEGGRNPIALPFDEAATAAWDESLAELYKDGGYFNGKRYGFPAEGGSMMFMYINTDAMVEAGLDPETDMPETLDELYDLAVKLTKRDENGNIIRSGFQPRYLGGGDGVYGKFIPYFNNFGAKVLSDDLTQAEGYVNSETAVKALTWFRDLVAETSNLEFGSPESAFQSGQAAIINREGWFAQDTIDKAPNIHFKVIAFPAGEIAVGPGGSGWCNMISAKTKYPELCQEILAELAKPMYDITLHEPAGYPPVCQATMSTDNEYLMSMPYGEAMITMTALPPGPTYSTIPQSTPINQLFGDSIAAIIGGADVKTELDALAVRIDQLLSQS